MKKIVINLLLLLGGELAFAQVVGTPILVIPSVSPPLDQISDVPSFAFSTRKLKSSYIGFSIRVRNATNGAEANVSFDQNGIVSNESNVTYVVAGTSGATVGSTTTLALFKGSALLYVTTWYDQSGNNRNATQATATSQPELLLYSQNGKASLKYNGGQNLLVTATPNQILGTTGGGVQGIVGTLLFTCKLATLPANVFPYSIGFTDASQRRFMLHLNWSDGNAYFDAGEACCSGTRLFSNSTSVNLWKQYTMQRQDVTKIARVSSVVKLNASSLGPTTAVGVNYFGVGTAYDTVQARTGLYGEFGDFILFNKALTTTQISNIENNQMLFWTSY